MPKALIIVDMQYDLCEGGPLAHHNSLKIIPKINSIRDNFDIVIFTCKAHPNNHSTFKKFGGTDPNNCVINTFGNKIHDDLLKYKQDIIINRETLQKYSSDSVFYDAVEINKETNLKNILLSLKIKDLYFCGNGIDTNLFSSIIDAQTFGFNCHIIKDGFSYMNDDKAKKCLNYLENNSILFI